MLICLPCPLRYIFVITINKFQGSFGAKQTC